jgi:hypothetical protein
MVICNRCQKEKEDTGFYKRKGCKGEVLFTSVCKECISIANKSPEVKNRRFIAHKEWVKNNPQKSKDLAKKHIKKQRSIIKALIDSYKEQPCMDCKKQYDKALMEFDHRPGTNKKFVIGKVSGGTAIETIQEEIDKCDLVCVMCHRLRTESRYIRVTGKLSKTVIYMRKLLDKINEIKTNTPCAICGGHFHPIQMDFDHIDPGQKTRKHLRTKTKKGFMEANTRKRWPSVDYCVRLVIN